MKINKIYLVASVFLACAMLFAQTIRKPGQLTIIVDTTPGAIPTSLTDVIRQDCFICSADFTGVNQSLIVQDRQATPVPWISGTFTSQSSWPFMAPSDGTCRRMPGGISWQAGATGVTGYLTIKCLNGPCILLSNAPQ